MKPLSYLCILAIAAALLLGSLLPGQTQAPQPEPMQVLQGMREQNRELIQKQESLLEQLEELEEAARQTKIFASRS